MSDSTTDEKIAQLVRSVLEAVDLRLSEVRRELDVAGQEADRRHLEVQQELRDLSVRIDRIDSAQRRGTAAHDLIEQQVAELRTGLARLHQRVEHDTPVAPVRPTAAPVAPVVSPAPAPVTAPTAYVPAPVMPTAPVERSAAAQPTPAMPSLDRVAAPLVRPHLATPPITTEIPRINFDTDITDELPTLELRSAAPAAATPVAPASQNAAAPAAPAAPTADDPAIDLDQLANLLSERLGHLHLPPAQGQ